MARSWAPCQTFCAVALAVARAVAAKERSGAGGRVWAIDAGDASASAIASAAAHAREWAGCMRRILGDFIRRAHAIVIIRRTYGADVAVLPAAAPPARVFPARADAGRPWDRRPAGGAVRPDPRPRAGWRDRRVRRGSRTTASPRRRRAARAGAMP